jgi:agmatine deiminase
MITDAQTNFVYFSERLKDKHSNFVNELTKILNRHGYEPKFLKNTNDIWCRDYMPVQVSENKFVEYRFDPDYLLDRKWRRRKTYPDLVCETLDFDTIKSDLILDGGNIIKWIDKVVPDIEWKRIRGFRNRIVHDYFGIDYEIVWDIYLRG